ncbi:MAG: hypothetical protein HY660_12035 [Armatimonadetes bacterium]|nr:hypothetical protein [Armatimonadota bacterium]
MLARRYEAETLQEALSLVHGDLGEDAVILYSREGQGPRWRRWLGGAGAEVIAMAPLALPRPPQRHGVLRPEEIARTPAPDPAAPGVVAASPAAAAPFVLRTYAGAASPPDIRSDVARTPRAAEAVRRDAEAPRREGAGSVVRRAAPIRITAGRCRVVALVGSTGVGKTTTVAKLACEHALRGHRVALIAADAYRMGAVAQLQGYARPLGVPLHVLKNPAQAARLAAELEACDLALVDLPGVPASEPGRLEAAEALVNALAPREVHLVLSATASVGVIEATQQALLALRPTRAILTHVDEISTAEARPVLRAVRLPISYLGCGPNVPGDLVTGRSRKADAWLAAG